MEKLGRGIVKARIPILVISILLLIPAALGYINTRVNYDILYYLPKEIDTMQGQDILLDEFQKGAYAIVLVDGMHGRELTKLEDKIENVDHVAKLISYNSIVGGDIPLEMIPILNMKNTGTRNESMNNANTMQASITAINT